MKKFHYVIEYFRLKTEKNANFNCCFSKNAILCTEKNYGLDLLSVKRNRIVNSFEFKIHSDAHKILNNLVTDAFYMHEHFH